MMLTFAQPIAQLGWEARAIHALRRNLTLVIPVSTFFLKIIVQYFSRDDWKEILKSLSSLPLEIMFIAMSFMLGALSGLSPTYDTRIGNQGDADLYAVLVICGIFALCLLINFLIRFVRKLFGKLYVAGQQIRKLLVQHRIPEQHGLFDNANVPDSGAVPDIAISGRIIWATAYCTFTTLVLSSAFGISIGTLAYVLHLIQ